MDHRGILPDILNHIGYSSSSIDAAVSSAFHQDKQQLSGQNDETKRVKIIMPIATSNDVLTFLFEYVGKTIRTLEVVLTGPNREVLYRRMPQYAQQIIKI